MDALLTILMVLGFAFAGLFIIWIVSLVIATVVIAVGAAEGKQMEDLNDIDFS